jgi:hypothetical protein
MHLRARKRERERERERDAPVKHWRRETAEEAEGEQRTKSRMNCIFILSLSSDIEHASMTTHI